LPSFCTTIERLFLAIALLVTLAAATARAEELSPPAREPYLKGMNAAQQRDWPLAIGYFTQAQKADPEAPEIWFNLALADSKLPGHELRAVALFKAYLLANPGAANAAAIRKQIAALEAKFESKLGKILDELESFLLLRKSETAGGFTADVQQARRSVESQTGWSLAEGRYFLGDTSAALAGLRRTNEGKWKKGWVENGAPVVHLSTALAAAGKLDEALGLAPQLSDRDVLGFFLEQGDFERVRQAVQPEAADSWSFVACAAHYHGEGSLEYEAQGKAKVKIEDLVESGACQRELWWSAGRIRFLLQRGVDGVAVNNRYNETELPEYLQHMDLDSTHAGWALSGVSSAAANIATLLQEYRKIRGPVSAHDDYAEAYLLRGNVYYSNAQYDRAIVNYDQAVRVDPDYSRAYFNLGLTYIKKLQYDKAIEKLKSATRINPDYADAYFSIGHCYNSKGEYDRAVEYYRHAMRLDPDYGLPDDFHGTPKPGATAP
jgi:tetratricopeptide (TPR) repeat protein